MGMFDKMRNAFARNNSDEKEELERTREEQRQARIKTLLCDREMLLKELESMWNNKKVKKRIKQEVINMIVNNLEELRSMGYELSEEEQMVPVVTDDMEEEKGGAPAKKEAVAVEPREPKMLEATLFDFDDKPAIPFTKNKPKKASYDIVPLPSKGQCYPCKHETIAVAYLTGADEDIIATPSLYQDGKIIDQLLYNNIVDEDFDFNELCLGDADAIILWLRANGYGYDFPITVTDPMTGELISSSVDLSKINPRPFNLEGDENGWFSFTMPTTGDEIKFKFMTRAMDRRIHRAELVENQALNRKRMEDCLKDMAEILAGSKIKDSMSEAEKKAVLDGIRKWNAALDDEAQIPYTHLLTNKMEVTIMSINGNTDRDFIHEYVINMPTKDSYLFRKFYNENEPGLDFEVTIERPVDEQGLGGGSFTTFLPWDYTLFTNIGKL